MTTLPLTPALAVQSVLAVLPSDAGAAAATRGLQQTVEETCFDDPAAAQFAMALAPALPADLALALAELERRVCQLLACQHVRFVWPEEAQGGYCVLNHPQQPGRRLPQLTPAVLATTLPEGTPHHAFSFFPAEEGAPCQGLLVVGWQTLPPPGLTGETPQAALQGQLETLARLLAPQLRAWWRQYQQAVTAEAYETSLALFSTLMGVSHPRMLPERVLSLVNQRLGFAKGAYWPPTGPTWISVSQQSPASDVPSRVAGLASNSALCPPAWEDNIPRFITEWLHTEHAEKAPYFAWPLALGQDTDKIGWFCWTGGQEEVVHHRLAVANQLQRLMAPALPALFTRCRAWQDAQEGAQRDMLTGLLNRRAFAERFAQECARVRRKPAPMAVVMIDIDHFKHINDTHGHLLGDDVLRSVGQTLVGNLRKQDVVCRYGGEEFALLLPDTPLEAACDLLDRIRRRVAHTPLLHDGASIAVTLSAGVAMAQWDQQPDAPASALLRHTLAEADAQLYQAKRQGRNRVCASQIATQSIPFSLPLACTPAAATSG